MFLRPLVYTLPFWLALLASAGAGAAPDPAQGRDGSGPPQATEPTPGAPATGELGALVDGLRAAETRPEARRRLLELGPRAVSPLLGVLQQEDGHPQQEDLELRLQVIGLLSAIRDPRALPALARTITHDYNPRIRWQSVAAVSKYPDPSPALDLLRRDLSAEDERLRWNAAVGLSMFGIADGLEVLHAGVLSRDAWRRWEAVTALGQVHDETTARTVGQLLLSPIADDRENAVLALGQIGDGKAFLLLLSALGDESPGVRWRACMALGRIGKPEALLPLHDLKLRETDPKVLEHAEKAILRLEALL